MSPVTAYTSPNDDDVLLDAGILRVDAVDQAEKATACCSDIDRRTTSDYVIVRRRPTYPAQV